MNTNDHKRTTLFSANLAEANRIAESSGLPKLTLADAIEHYGNGGHDYCPSAPDKGQNSAAAGSPMHFARWEIALVLNEGVGAVVEAGTAADERFGQLVAALPELNRLTDAIAERTQKP